MRIGIPREIKPLEGRVVLTPEACAELVKDGHRVHVEQGAGTLSGYPDERYLAAGAGIAASAAELYRQAGLIVKVKEPQAAELALLREDHLLFCFLHLAPNPGLARALQDIGLTAIAFETVEEDSGYLPLLAPMSDIAGRVAAQVGTHLLHYPQGGKGLLLGGLPAAERGRVIVLGGGTAGGSAAAMAAGIGAEVVVFDVRRERLAGMRQLGNNVTALYPYQASVEREVSRADLLIGAVLITGAKTPHVVHRELVAQMQPGSVIVDISVDQGGCIETTRATTYDDPTYVEEGVVHFSVANMPGGVPRSATQALSAVLFPYVKLMCDSEDWQSASTPLRRGINIAAGKVVHPALMEAFA